MSFIKPAGDFQAEELKAAKKRGIAWCRVCGRKHPRKDPCDLVEYQQGDEYEKMAFDEEAGRERLMTKRHPGRSIHRTLYEKGIHEQGR